MISMDKACKTRDGRKVRILCTDAPGPYPVIGYVEYRDRWSDPHAWDRHGKWMNGGDANLLDLVEVRSAEDVVFESLRDHFYLAQDTAIATAAEDVVRKLCVAGMLKEDAK